MACTREMIRNRKTLAFVLSTALVLSAFLADSASASPLTVNEGSTGTTYYTADQDGGNQVYKTPEGEVKCNTAVYSATSTGFSVSELTFTPDYTNCTAFGFANVDLNTNGCTYTFDEPTAIAGAVTWDPSQIHLVCPAGKSIEITPTFTFLGMQVAICTQFIGPQTPGGGHIVGKGAGSNTANGMDITLEITLEGIAYTSTGGQCGSKEVTHTDGVAFGLSTLRAFSNAAHTTQRGITFS